MEDGVFFENKHSTHAAKLLQENYFDVTWTGFMHINKTKTVFEFSLLVQI